MVEVGVGWGVRPPDGPQNGSQAPKERKREAKEKGSEKEERWKERRGGRKEERKKRRVATRGWGARGVGHKGSSTGDQAEESQFPENMWDASPVG